MSITPTQQCPVCKKEFPQTGQFFYLEKRKNGALSLRGICKQCWNERSAKNKQKKKGNATKTGNYRANRFTYRYRKS